MNIIRNLYLKRNLPNYDGFTKNDLEEINLATKNSINISNFSGINPDLPEKEVLIKQVIEYNVDVTDISNAIESNAFSYTDDNIENLVRCKSKELDISNIIRNDLPANVVNDATFYLEKDGKGYSEEQLQYMNDITQEFIAAPFYEKAIGEFHPDMSLNEMRDTLQQEYISNLSNTYPDFEFIDKAVPMFTKEMSISDMQTTLEEVEESCRQYEYDAVSPKMSEVKAEKLPDGWTWRMWEDGSGSLRSPEGKDFCQYDLHTNEYKLFDEEWSYDPDMMIGLDFSAIEEKIYDKLSKQPEESYSQYDAVAPKMSEVKAEKLPDGWTWRMWEDGSGSLRSPEDKVFCQYDLHTNEYKLFDEEWSYDPDMMTGLDFSAIEEKIYDKLLSNQLDIKNGNIDQTSAKYDNLQKVAQKEINVMNNQRMFQQQMDMGL